MLPTLKPNDTIYICAPAKAIDTQSIRFTQGFFKKNGYQVELSKHVLGQNNYFSGNEEERLSDLQRGLDHSTAKAILCARGGYGCIQLLEKLDWTTFKKNPKWIIGFSDVTVLHLALSKMGIPSLHASMPLNFEKNTPDSLLSLLSALKQESFEIVAPSSPFNKFGEISAEVVGGNLAIVHAMLTYLSPAFFKNKILFIEDVGEHLYQIDRMFYGLKFIEALDNIGGLVVGAFTDISDTDSPFGNNLEEIVSHHLSHRQIPVGFNFPCGHQNDNQAIIMGQKMKLIVAQNGSRLISTQKAPLS